MPFVADVGETMMSSSTTTSPPDLATFRRTTVGGGATPVLATFRRASVADVGPDVWPARARAYTLQAGESDLWRSVLGERGWRDAGELCRDDRELAEVVAGVRPPPPGAKRRCLNLNLYPREHNALSRLPATASNDGCYFLSESRLEFTKNRSCRSW